MTDDKKINIEFAPGCFDSFDGTQEELDEMIAEIKSMFESGEIGGNTREVDLDKLMEEDPELADILIDRLSQLDDTQKRTLQ